MHIIEYNRLGGNKMTLQELNAMKVKDLKALAKENTIYIGNMTKAEIVQKLYFKLVTHKQDMKHMRERT